LSVVRGAIPVIDLFAGPGGLGEGFSALVDSGRCPFRIALSVEKDPYAHQTLRLRSFFRQFPRGEAPDLYYRVLRREVPLQDLPVEAAKFPELLAAWQKADHEVLCTELGPQNHQSVRSRINAALGPNPAPWILIGGPPCQAYSLAGRVRNKGIENYRIEDDKRSKLYEEYLHIIAEHQPTIFVMENVKGMLSATVENQKIFEKILSDLQCPAGKNSSLRYRIVPIVTAAEAGHSPEDDPRRFIVQCEDYGVPQQRHRVILVGLIDTIGNVSPPPLVRSPAPTVKSVIDSLPRLRSGLSRSRQGGKYVTLVDNEDTWWESIRRQVGADGYPSPAWLHDIEDELANRILSSVEQITRPRNGRGDEFLAVDGALGSAHCLHDFLTDSRLPGVCNHATRAHMDSDLIRYLFCAVFARQHGDSPRLEHFPRGLLPRHENATTGDFNDRFRVQLANTASTTITSHISKDGHYFIHYDPTQCRSLTVREAARLQTFPDNYLFCGPRTQQYTQVGNAVPSKLFRVAA
jgi:DNA (cytosine-5)-methyltransferase 1